MTSGRSGLRLPWLDDGRLASWCGSRAKARISLGIWVSEFGPPRPFGRVSMCRPAHRSIRCRSRWAQGTCLLPSMTITPWCSPIKRPDLLGRETGTGKFVTRVEVMLQSHGHCEFQRCIATRAPRGTMPDRKWCSSRIESAIRTQTRLHHLIDTSKVETNLDELSVQ